MRAEHRLQPLRLTDHQLSAVMSAAGTLPPRARDAFVKAVAGELQGAECPADAVFDLALRRVVEAFQHQRLRWLS